MLFSIISQPGEFFIILGKVFLSAALIGIQDAAKIFGIFINLSTGIKNKFDSILFCDKIKLTCQTI